jgi:hypothetical protein
LGVGVSISRPSRIITIQGFLTSESFNNNVFYFYPGFWVILPSMQLDNLQLFFHSFEQAENWLSAPEAFFAGEEFDES